MGAKNDRQSEDEIRSEIKGLIADALSKPKAQMPPGGGVYLIVNSINGAAYVGQTCNFRPRISGHKSALRAGRHSNIPMQRDWVRFGEDAFWFFPIWQLDKPKGHNLLFGEITAINTFEDGLCYNKLELHERMHDKSGVRLKRHSLKMTPDEWEAFRELGGIDWLRAVIDRAKAPVKK